MGTAAIVALDPIADDPKSFPMGSEPEARRRFQREMSLEGAERLIKPGLSFAALDAEANALSDLESARLQALRHRYFWAWQHALTNQTNAPAVTISTLHTEAPKTLT